MSDRYLFVAAMRGYPWGGSEELWATAAECLVRRGHDVAALVPWWPMLPARLQTLRSVGVDVRVRREGPRSLASRIGTRLLRQCGVTETADQRWLRRWSPDLVCVSHGNYYDGLEWIEYVARRAMRFVNVSQANGEHLWPDDQTADRIIAGLSAAKRAFFVSEANRRLVETQLGVPLRNAEVVRNPFNVAWNADIGWPGDDAGTRLACPARLDPAAKGQDLLLHVLAKDKWRKRRISVSLFGSGPMERSLKRLTAELGLEGVVKFGGHVSSVEEIWRNHHALVMPSRYEGMPLALVEAMLCGRPSIVTNVAGNPELIRDNETGFLAAAPTVELLDEAMERAWQRRDEWKAIGSSAQKWAREHIPEHPADVFADRLLSLATT